MPDTGVGPLPDIGKCAYNGIVFSCLFKSHLNGVPVKDKADRTIIAVEWTLDVEGFVTLDVDSATIDNTIQTMVKLLTARGGTLTYEGKGFGTTFTVNPPNDNVSLSNIGGSTNQNSASDVAWGPTPTLFSIQPLGASRSALVKWSVVFTIPYSYPTIGPLLQFSEEIVIAYDEDNYSTVSIRGIMEIPLRRRRQTSGAVATTVDAHRQRFLDQVADTIDLTRFRVKSREFDISADRRTMLWTFVAEEMPPMGLPHGSTNARGKFSVRPDKIGPGLVKWVCSLNATYTIPPGFSRRVAWIHFTTLLAFRMTQSILGNPPDVNNNNAAQQQPPAPPPNTLLPGPPGLANSTASAVLNSLITWARARSRANAQAAQQQRCVLIDFGFDEGLYLDSRSMSFHASWWLFTTYPRLLAATGVWRTAGLESGASQAAGEYWAASVRNIQGWKGNLANVVDGSEDVIVDLQLGEP